MLTANVVHEGTSGHVLHTPRHASQDCQPHEDRKGSLKIMRRLSSHYPLSWRLDLSHSQTPWPASVHRQQATAPPSHLTLTLLHLHHSPCHTVSLLPMGVALLGPPPLQPELDDARKRMPCPDTSWISGPTKLLPKASQLGLLAAHSPAFLPMAVGGASGIGWHHPRTTCRESLHLDAQILIHHDTWRV